MPNPDAKRALIVEPGRSRGALTGARALRTAGWEVGVASPGEDLAGHSRAVSWRHRVPPLHDDPGAFIAAVEGACAQVGYRLVFGADDAEALALADHREALSAQVAHPPASAMYEALDKSRLDERAREAGLTVPSSYPADAKDLPPGPLLVKPNLRRLAGDARVATELVAGPADARALRDVLAADGEGAFFQERLDGNLLGLSVVTADDGRVVAAVQQEADRLFPPGTGMSAHATTVPVDTELVGRVERLLRELGWFGIAQLQFMAPADREPALVDLNARFYGSMGLALQSGLNLPALWAGLAVGDAAPPKLLLGRPGVEYQWLEGDLRRAFAERRGGLLRDLVEVLRPVRGRVGPIWSARDPAPALRHTLRLAGIAFRRGAADARPGR